MTPDEFKRRALAHLDQCDEADMEELATKQPTADWFADLHTRWGHARAAFPGMDWEEFCALDTARNRKGKRGRPQRSPAAAFADDRLWPVARDIDRIKALWKQLHPDTPRPRAPIHPHDLAAERHRLSMKDRQALEDRIRRPNARRTDRKNAAQK